ncbi:MAG: hypothetical protein ISS70_07330 [Phycisphaerae bacterium]|nr:hypothetical protein [Phycisphaerae bacterium]
MALSLVEKEGKAGSRALAVAIFDREEGKALQTQVVEDKREPMTRQELEQALAELDELEREADIIQMQVNRRVG